MQEPYGVEALLLFATTGSIESMLAPVKYDNNAGLYKIDDNPNQVLENSLG